MKRLWLVFLAALLVLGFTPKVKSDVITGKGVKLYIGGQAKIRPAYYYNVDLDDDAGGAAVLWEGGTIKDTDFVTEGEVRLIFKATGDKWGFMLIPEHRFIYSKRIADRDYSEASNAAGDSGISKAYGGTQWGIEKLRLWYNFAPWFKFATGWFDPDTWLDPIGTFVYANDDPFIKFYGDISKNLYWEFVFLEVFEDYTGMEHQFSTMNSKGDWYVYWLKTKFKFNNGYIAPFVAYSDFSLWLGDIGSLAPGLPYYITAETWYPGVEGKFNFGKVTFAFDVATAQGNYDVDNMDGDMDIDAWAWFWYIKYNLSKAFQPYLGMYYWSGDDDPTDNDIEGWVGIGNGEMLAELTKGPFAIPRDLRGTGGFIDSGLYSYQPLSFRALTKYSTIGYSCPYGYYGAMGGLSPGAYFLGLGAQGVIGKWSYKMYGYYYWMDEDDFYDVAGYTDNGRPIGVDKEIGYGFDSAFTYTFSKNFKTTIMFEIFEPGDGLEDIIESDQVNGDATTAFRLAVNLLWKF